MPPSPPPRPATAGTLQCLVRLCFATSLLHEQEDPALSLSRQQMISSLLLSPEIEKKITAKGKQSVHCTVGKTSSCFWLQVLKVPPRTPGNSEGKHIYNRVETRSQGSILQKKRIPWII